MDTNILRSWSEAIFKSLQPVQDGGIFTPLTQVGQKNFTIADTLLWLRDLLLRPYYSVTIVLGAIWSIIVPLLLLLLLLRFCRKNYLCCYKCVRQLQRGVNAVGRRCLGRKQLVSELPNRPLACKNETKKVGATFAKLICCFVCMIGLCAGLYYTAFESYEVQYFLNENENSTQSYKTYKDASILELKDFLENGVRQANTSTMEWVDVFHSKLSKEMTAFVRHLSDELFVRFGVYSTLNESEKVLNQLTAVFNAMQFINGNRRIVQQASVFAGRVNAIKEIMENDLKCANLEIPYECYTVFTTLKRLVMNIEWSSVDFDTSTSIINLLQQQNLDILLLSNEAEKSRGLIKSYVKKFEKDGQRLLRDANIMNEISKIWNVVDAMLNDGVISLLDDLMIQQPEQKYMSQASSIWRMVADFGWSICLTFAIIVFITLIFAVFKLGFKLSAAKRISRREKYHASNLESLFANKKTSAIDVCAEKMKQAQEEKIEEDPGSVWIYRFLRFLHVISGLLLIAPCLITLVIFLCNGVLTTEVCRYLVDDKGVEVADGQINVLIGRIWEDSVASLNLSSFLILKRPSHVLTGVFQTCRKPNMSIIESFGMTGIFNASEFTSSPTFEKLMDAGYVGIKKNFANFNPDTMIPLNVIKYIDEGAKFIEKFIDGKNYTESVRELNEPFFKNIDFPSYIDSLVRVSRSFPNLEQKGDILKRLLPMYSSLKNETTILRNQFEVLVKYSNLSQKLLDVKTLLQSAASTMKNETFKNSVLPNAYRLALTRMIGNVSAILQTDIDNLEQRLFPCQQLHNAYSIFMRAMCGDLRNGLGSFALSLAMTVIWFQFCFLFSWCLVSTLKPIFPQEDCTNC